MSHRVLCHPASQIDNWANSRFFGKEANEGKPEFALSKDFFRLLLRKKIVNK